MRNVGNISLMDIIPDNLKQDMQIQAMCQAIDMQISGVVEAIPEVLLTQQINLLPENILDELAWQLHCDFYQPDLPVEQKRKVIQSAWKWHMYKGTPAAVEELIAAVFGDGQVVEWWEYDGDPYTFEVHTNNPEATTTKALDFIRAIDTAKNLRSKLDRVVIENTAEMPLYFAGFVHIGDMVRIGGA